jgi:hypothetical protein
MGLNFCTSQIPVKTTNLTEKSMRETLIEISAASRVAIEILNDLLLYDKLESGLVTLKKEVVGVIDFMSECLQMFAVQIRAKNISLSFVNKTAPIRSEGHCTGTASSDTTSLQDSAAVRNLMTHNHDINQIQQGRISAVSKMDKFEVDKSKLSQVIRNIMSNAIKFTPDDGNIQIIVEFETYTTRSSSDSVYESSNQSTNESDHVLTFESSKSMFKLAYDKIHKTILGNSTSSNYSLLPPPPSVVNRSSSADSSDLESGKTAETSRTSLSDTASFESGLLIIEIKDSH